MSSRTTMFKVYIFHDIGFKLPYAETNTN